MIEAKTKRVKKCIFTFLHFYTTSMKKGMSVFIFTHTFFYVRFEKGSRGFPPAVPRQRLGLLGSARTVVSHIYKINIVETGVEMSLLFCEYDRNGKPPPDL